MDAPSAKLWRLVPGYLFEDEEDSPREDRRSSAKTKPVPTRTKILEEAGEIVEAERDFRLQEILSMLGPRYTDRPMISFEPTPMGSKSNVSWASLCSANRKTGAQANTPSMFHLQSEAPILRETFLLNGLLPTIDNNFMIHWSGPNIRDSVYQVLNEWQRINHFPGSTELTRKDRLWVHFAQMAEMFGTGAFDFVPETYVLPEQVDQFLECYERTKYAWIVKPNSSSRGRGIHILRDLSELPLDENIVVCRYVQNPLLIQGLKFDLRVYVLVTAFDPLKAYIYREGLTRFASKLYSNKDEHMQDLFRHLTNYSINKNSAKFVENSDLKADNVGHKWSLSALNKHLQCVGVDVNLMWVRIMDLIVKTLLSVEPSITARTRACTPNRENCFELYGFDVLVDDELKPWLLEVNLSPSMQAESPLDWQIKSSLAADTFNIVGVAQCDRQAAAGDRAAARMQSSRPPAATDTRAPQEGRNVQQPTEPPVVLNALSDVQLKLLVKSLGERARCHNYVPLYPTRDTVGRYAPITEALLQGGAAASELATTSTRRLSASQILASLLFGPRPIRSVAPRRRSLTINGRRPGASSSPHPSAGDSEHEEELEQQEEDEHADPEGEAGKASASVSSQLLPASVRDPEVKAADREAALLVAMKSLRSLKGRRRRSDRRSSKADGEEDGQEEEEADEERESDESLGSSTGCRLLLAEYLLRLEAACGDLPADAKALLAQSSAYARLSTFQRRIPSVAAQLSSGGASDSSPSSDDDQESGCLIDDLGASCREGLKTLEHLTWKEAGQEPATADASSDENEGDEELSQRVLLLRRLPRTVIRHKHVQRLIKVLPELGAAELETLLHGPLAAGGQGQGAAALRPLLDAFLLGNQSPSGESEERQGLGALRVSSPPLGPVGGQQRQQQKQQRQHK
ncbi:unnamed protein product [Polarella glacialis]|uniref:Tubulin--tyrosine ligase-like protein 5 n=1 Tax=Polarella glacialis TaxID=89957 RepID=A0A813J1Q0_POLGL|nr:unnamed protein product [Polarella glacialis]